MFGLFAACTRSGDYDLDAISDVTLRNANPKVLIFRTRLETAFYTPGAKLEKKADADYLRIVRCQVGATCEVDLPAKPGEGGLMEIVLPAEMTRPIKIVGKSGAVDVPAAG